MSPNHPRRHHALHHGAKSVLRELVLRSRQSRVLSGDVERCRCSVSFQQSRYLASDASTAIVPRRSPVDPIHCRENLTCRKNLLATFCLWTSCVGQSALGWVIVLLGAARRDRTPRELLPRQRICSCFWTCYDSILWFAQCCRSSPHCLCLHHGIFCRPSSLVTPPAVSDVCNGNVEIGSGHRHCICASGRPP